MIVHEIDIADVSVLEAENNTPVAGHGHAPEAFLAAERW
jgi:hypothetical protein